MFHSLYKELTSWSRSTSSCASRFLDDIKQVFQLPATESAPTHLASAFVGWLLHGVYLATDFVLDEGVAVVEDLSNSRNEQRRDSGGLVWSLRLCTACVEWNAVRKVRESNVGLGEQL